MKTGQARGTLNLGLALTTNRVRGRSVNGHEHYNRQPMNKLLVL
jgi:hypothetical protein